MGDSIKKIDSLKKIVLLESIRIIFISESYSYQNRIHIGIIMHSNDIGIEFLEFYWILMSCDEYYKMEVGDTFCRPLRELAEGI